MRIDTVYGAPTFLGPIPQKFGDGVEQPGQSDIWHSELRGSGAADPVRHAVEFLVQTEGAARVTMPIPTEPIGSIPRPPELAGGNECSRGGKNFQRSSSMPPRTPRCATPSRVFEATGSPVITDGEQTKPSFATYPLSGLEQSCRRRRGRFRLPTDTPGSCPG